MIGGGGEGGGPASETGSQTPSLPIPARGSAPSFGSPPVRVEDGPGHEQVWVDLTGRGQHHGKLLVWVQPPPGSVYPIQGPRQPEPEAPGPPPPGRVPCLCPKRGHLDSGLCMEGERGTGRHGPDFVGQAAVNALRSANAFFVLFHQFRTGVAVSTPFPP